HRNRRIERARRDVEPHLIIALARAAVGDGGRLLDRGNLDELPRNEWPAERGAHRIPIFVDRAGLEGSEDIVARELLADVEDMCAHGAGGEGSVAHVLELPSLPEIQRDG